MIATPRAKMKELDSQEENPEYLCSVKMLMSESTERRTSRC